MAIIGTQAIPDRLAAVDARDTGPTGPKPKAQRISMYQDPVEQAIKERDELLARMKAEMEGPNPTVEDKPDTDEPGQDVADDKEKAPVEPVEPKVEPKPAQEPEPEKPVEKPVEDPNSETYKARWETLQGKYNAELFRINAELHNARGEILTLRQELAEAKATAKEMVAKPKQQDTQPPATAVEAVKKLSEEYGQDFTNLIQEMVRAGVQDVVQSYHKDFEQQIDQRVKPVEEQVAQAAQTAQQSESERRENQLTSLCPNWRELNLDPDFVTYVKSEEIGGYSLYDLMNDAYGKGNIPAVAKIFNGYIQAKTPAPTPTPTPPVKPTPDALMAPSGRGTGTQTTVDNNQGRIITRAEVDQFYRDLENGKLTPEVAAAKRAEIMKANAEGRITG